MTLALLALAAHYVRAIQYTPVEATQGMAQKIFYVHVPAAWSAFLAYGIVGLCSALFLWLHDRRLDLFAEASAEVGTVLTFIVLTTGPLWGKPIWGTWWQWGGSAHLHAVPVLPVRGLPDAASLRLRSARAGAVQRGGGHPGRDAGAIHPFERVDVSAPSIRSPSSSSPMVRRCRARCSPPCSEGFAIFTVLYLGMVMVRYGIGRLQEEKEARHAAAS
jgi:hypothetical protein